MKSLIAFFLFYGLFLQEGSAQKINLQEVFSYSGDNVVDVIEEVVAREAIIDLATQGILVKSNSDIVKDPRKPKIIIRLLLILKRRKHLGSNLHGEENQKMQPTSHVPLV